MLIIAQYGDETKIFFSRSELPPDPPDLVVKFPVEWGGAKSYAEKKARARDIAIEFSIMPFPVMTWGEYAEIDAHFRALGKRFGLLREFRENGIC